MSLDGKVTFRGQKSVCGGEEATLREQLLFGENLFFVGRSSSLEEKFGEKTNLGGRYSSGK